MRYRTVLIALALLAGLAVGKMALPASACAGMGCPAVACISSAFCMGECVCLKRGAGMGTCVSFD